MKRIKIYMSAVAIMSVALTGCDDKAEYAPAAPDSPDCLGVYFDENNPQDFIFVPGGDATVTLDVHRLNTKAAADVPVVGKASGDGLKFPSTVHFDAGSADAQLVIDCNGLPLSQKVVFSVNFPDEYINHYAATLFCYESSALVSNWEPANIDGSPVKFYFTSTDYATQTSPKVQSAVYQPVESEMEVLPGAAMIRVKNFLNTGTDMTFNLTPSPYPDYEGMYRVSPVDHYWTMNEVYESDEYGDDWYNPWFLSTGEGDDEDYAEAVLLDLDGNESVLDYPQFYWYSNSLLYEYSYAVLKSSSRPYNSVSMGISGTTDGSVSLPSYFYLYFSWDGQSGL